MGDAYYLVLNYSTLKLLTLNSQLLVGLDGFCSKYLVVT
jgi:hypothetical protein